MYSRSVWLTTSQLPYFVLRHFTDRRWMVENVGREWWIHHTSEAWSIKRSKKYSSCLTEKKDEDGRRRNEEEVGGVSRRGDRRRRGRRGRRRNTWYIRPPVIIPFSPNWVLSMCCWMKGWKWSTCDHLHTSAQADNMNKSIQHQTVQLWCNVKQPQRHGQNNSFLEYMRYWHRKHQSSADD